MTRSKAIKAYCLECGGGLPKEVTLCMIGDCPLYPFRFGNSPESKGYRARMGKAAENWPAELAEVVADHPQVALLCKAQSRKGPVFRPRGRKGVAEAREG